MKVYVQGEKKAPPPSSSRGPTRKRPSPSNRPPPPQQQPLRHAPLFPSFHPDRAAWPERDLVPLELTAAQSRFIAGTVSDIREREREAQRRRRTALSSASLADPSSGGSSSSAATSAVKRQKVEAAHHPHGGAADGVAPGDAGGVRGGERRPRQLRLFQIPRGGGGRSFVEYVDSYPEVPQFVATSGSMITHGEFPYFRRRWCPLAVSPGRTADDKIEKIPDGKGPEGNEALDGSYIHTHPLTRFSHLSHQKQAASPFSRRSLCRPPRPILTCPSRCSISSGPNASAPSTGCWRWRSTDWASSRRRRKKTGRLARTGRRPQVRRNPTSAPRHRRRTSTRRPSCQGWLPWSSRARRTSRTGGTIPGPASWRTAETTTKTAKRRR